MATGTWKIAGIGFDHMHMGDLLRMVHTHPGASIAGICDANPDRMRDAAAKFSLGGDRVFTDYRECLEKTRPDIVILCSSTAQHREWVEKVAPFNVHVLVEKPFASNLADADAMAGCMEAAGKRLAVNWPLAWYPSHITCRRIVSEGLIGRPLEVHYYDGNRGPLFHAADKEETCADADSPQRMLEAKRAGWWYRKAEGGGSLLDYLGYGATLGTWFLDGEAPLEIMAMADKPEGLEVDEHSITLARYKSGLSKFETRWGAFTDPWTHQPQPKCGFVVVGSEGTVSSYDFEKTIRIQDRKNPGGYEIPVDEIKPPFRNPIQYLIHCLESDLPLEGPLSPAIARVGQQIVDSAVLSSTLGKAVPLVT